MAYGNPISNINVWKNWSPNTAPKIGGSGYLGGSNVLGSGGITSAGTTPAPAPTPAQLGYNPISYSGQTAAPGLGFPQAAPYQSARDAQGYLLAPYKASDSSKWQSLMNQKIQGDTAQGIDTAAATQASANQQALSNLMMRGGASGGAGERIGAAGALGMMKAQQAQRQLGQQNLYDVAQKGELMNREAESQNIQRALQDLGGVNQYNQSMLDLNTKYQMGLDANPNAVSASPVVGSVAPVSSPTTAWNALPEYQAQQPLPYNGPARRSNPGESMEYAGFRYVADGKGGWIEMGRSE